MMKKLLYYKKVFMWLGAAGLFATLLITLAVYGGWYVSSVWHIVGLFGTIFVLACVAGWFISNGLAEIANAYERYEADKYSG